MTEILGHERVLVDPRYSHHNILPDHSLHRRWQDLKMRDFQPQRKGLQGSKGGNIGEEFVEVDLRVNFFEDVSDYGEDEIASRIILHYNRWV